MLSNIIAFALCTIFWRKNHACKTLSCLTMGNRGHSKFSFLQTVNENSILELDGVLETTSLPLRDTGKLQ